eukprot:PhF_6_TR32351/c0_g1_i1/m.47973
MRRIVGYSRLGNVIIPTSPFLFHSRLQHLSSSALRSTHTSSLASAADDFVFPVKYENTNPLFDATVRREVMHTEDTEFTIMGNVVKDPRHGAPHQRENTRLYSEKEQNENSDKTLKVDLSVGTVGQLPYDDYKMAEAVLEMEVEGQIDETWQDTKTAHEEDVEHVVKVLNDSKAMDVVVVCTKDKTYAFDYVVFATCHGSRHINLTSWALQEANKYVCLGKVNKNLRETEWEPIPVGRIIVNLMTESYRERANLERKWVLTSSCDPLNFCHAAVSEGRGIASHGLWTLTLNIQDLEDFENDYCREALLRQL